MKYLTFDYKSELENESKFRGFLLSKLVRLCDNLFISECNCPVCQTFNNRSVCRFLVQHTSSGFKVSVFPSDENFETIKYLLMPIVGEVSEMDIDTQYELFLDKFGQEKAIKVSFETPLDIGRNGKTLTEFRTAPFFNAIKRRAMNLSVSDSSIDSFVSSIINETTYAIANKTQDTFNQESYRLKGIIGNIYISNFSNDILRLLFMAEHFGVGKNINKGCGRITISK